MENSKKILSVNSMSMGFKTDYGYLPIMHDIDFDIYVDVMRSCSAPISVASVGW